MTVPWGTVNFISVESQLRNEGNKIHCSPWDQSLRNCLQGGRVTLASGLTLAGGQKIARVYKQNFTGRVTLQPRTT